MPVSKIRRGAAPAQVGYPNANTVRVDSSTEELIFGTGASGTTEKTAVDKTTAQTLVSKTFTTPTITDPTITGVLQEFAASAAVKGVTEIAVNKVLLDNTTTDFFTVTVPNSIAAASVDLLVSSGLGDGDSTDTARYTLGISRIAGANAKMVISAKSVVGATAGATGNAVITTTASAVAGAVGAVNTFTIVIKNARSAGAATNHPTTAIAKLVNNLAAGVTIAAA